MIDHISPVRHIEIRLKLSDSVYVPADDTFLLICPGKGASRGESSRTGNRDRDNCDILCKKGFKSNRE